MGRKADTDRMRSDVRGFGDGPWAHPRGSFEIHFAGLFYKDLQVIQSKMGSLGDGGLWASRNVPAQARQSLSGTFQQGECFRRAPNPL